MSGTDVDGAHRLVLVGGPEAYAALVHPPEVPEHGALGAVDLEAVVVLLGDGDAAGLQHDPRAADHADQTGDVVVVLHRTHVAASGTGVPGVGPGRAGPLAEEDRGVGDEGVDVAEQVA